MFKMTRPCALPAGATLATVLTLIGGSTAAVHAQSTISDSALYSSYVQNKLNSASAVYPNNPGYVATSTPKAGTPGSGTIFYTNDSNIDAEGPGTTTPASTFAAYGLIDFATPYSFNAPVASLSNLQLKITEYPAGFGTTDPVDFYLVSNSTTSDYYSTNAANNSPLLYDTTTAGTNPQGVGTQLGTTYLLAGSVAYSKVKNQVDTINLTPSAAASSLIISQLNSGGDIRFVVAQDASAPAGAAEYDGSFYATGANPSPLSLNFSAFDANGNADAGAISSPAPEPSQIAGLGFFALGLAGVIWKARRKRNSAASAEAC